MKPGDFVRLRKSHPSVKRWRRQAKRYGSPAIGVWAEEGAALLHLGECDYGVGRVKVLGPDGSLASFDDYLLTTWGVL
tara:strand:- start:706 stop:939 length:234 start_codon:yes stop_codon:yes gene_type:complete